MEVIEVVISFSYNEAPHNSDLLAPTGDVTLEASTLNKYAD